MKLWVRRAAEVLLVPLLVFFVFPLVRGDNLSIGNFLAAAALAVGLLGLSWRGWSRDKDETADRQRQRHDNAAVKRLSERRGDDVRP